MKQNLFVLAVLCAFFTGVCSTIGQSTAFTYQGNLTLSGAPADGSFDLEFALYDAVTDGVQTGPTLTNLAVSVNKGLFTVSLDFLNEQNYGLFSQPFWLQIGARTNGGSAFTLLSPRQEILGVPYAFYAVISGFASNAASSMTAVTVAANGVGSGAIQNGAVTAANIANGQVVKSLNNLHDNVTLVAGANIGINANGQSITIAAAGAAGAGWSLTGNAGTSPGVNFVGTTDNQNLELHVNGQRALLLQASVPPNVIAGGSNNNSVATANYGGNAIAGGNSNAIGAFNSYGFIGGGLGNSMTLDSYEAILGGKFNTNDGMGSTIAGGALNDIESQADWAFIGGGSNNVIEMPDDFYTPECAVIGGGSENTDASTFAFVGGGQRNSLGYYSDSSVIGGGQNNVIENYAGWSFIGGGSNNLIDGSDDGEFSPGPIYSVIAGGQNNSVASNAPGAFIGGGKNNSMLAFSEDSVISGGEFNTNFGGTSVIAGGTGNYIENDGAAIGGGTDNSAKGQNSTVPGGEDNVAEGDWSFAAGVSAQALGDNTFVWGGGASGNPVTVEGDHDFVIADVNAVGINDTNPAFTLDVDGTIGASVQVLVGYNPKTDSAGVALYASGDITATGGISAQGPISCSAVTGGSVTASTLFVGEGLFGAALTVDNQGDLTAGGNITANGMICGQMCQPCDKNLKENFAAIDNREILERIINLPITRWDYKTEAGTLHVGPMAQDFYAAFHLGKDDKHINTIDEGGVALAAVQGLNSKVEEAAREKDGEISALKAANESLQKRLADLEKVVERLAANVPR